ncbi:MAG TPA: glycosyltransferase [Opitutaceae bacterium]|nr:glycosyltransferase [Opitutaceae bacterium]
MVSEPGCDGVFRYVEGLCHFLAGEGVQLHLAYSDVRSSDALPHLIAFIERQGGATLNLRISNRPSAADLPAFWRLHRLVRAVRPDVIHSHSSKAGALARGLAYAGIRAVQVYQPHAYVGMRPDPGRIDFAYNAVESRLGRGAHTLTCSSGERTFALETLRLRPERLHQVRHGVDLQKFRPPSPEEKAQLRASFGLPADAPVLGFLGRSSPQKDPLTLYRAFARAAAAEPRLQLLHVGSGELDPEIERLSAEFGLAARIVRRPYLAAPADFYRVVDGFILPSRYEGLSLAALEALASDLPMIPSDVAGNADMLALPLSHAWTVPAGDVEAVTLGIEAWLDGWRHPSHVNHRQIAESHFNIPRQLGAILGLYRSWVAGGGRASRLAPHHPRAMGGHGVG